MRWLVPGINAQIRTPVLFGGAIDVRRFGASPGNGWIIDGDTVVRVPITRRFNIVIEGDTVVRVELAA